MNSAQKRGPAQRFSMGVSRQLQTSHLRIYGYLSVHLDPLFPFHYHNIYLLPVSWKHNHFSPHNKSKTSVLYEEAVKRWLFLSVSKPDSFENHSNINHKLELHLPFFCAWCLTTSYKSWQKQTSQRKQRLFKANIPMDFS